MKNNIGLFRLLVLALVVVEIGCGQAKPNPTGSSKSTLGSTQPPVVVQPEKFNARVFFKNPNYAAGRLVGYGQSLNTTTGLYDVVPSTPVNFDGLLMGVKIALLPGSLLKNSDIDVRVDYLDKNEKVQPGTMKRAVIGTDGAALFSSVNDPDHKLTQFSVFYWADQQKKLMSSTIANGWSASGKSISIFSHCYDPNDGNTFRLNWNAFWAGAAANYVCFGHFGDLYEAALDSSIVAHELGHANLDYATNGQIYEGVYVDYCGSGLTSFPCCATVDGCASGINEGQADVHSQILFNSPVLGEFFENSMHGNRGRDAEFNANATVSDMWNGLVLDPATGKAFGQIGKEPHLMGGIWNASWWTLRKALGADVTAKIFLAHQELLTGNDTFKTALQLILTSDEKLVQMKVFSAVHRTEILAAFAHHGITL